MFAAGGLWAQEPDPSEELALSTEANWTELVVVLSSGKRVTYSRGDIARIEYVVPKAAPAAGGVSRLTSGQMLECNANDRGKLAANQLTFTEVEAIRAGAAHLNVEYSLAIRTEAASGSWIDHSDNNSRGTFTIQIP